MSSAVLFHSAIRFAIFYKMKLIGIFLELKCFGTLGSDMVKRPFLRYCVTGSDCRGHNKSSLTGLGQEAVQQTSGTLPGRRREVSPIKGNENARRTTYGLKLRFLYLFLVRTT